MPVPSPRWNARYAARVGREALGHVPDRDGAALPLCGHPTPGRCRHITSTTALCNVEYPLGGKSRIRQMGTPPDAQHHEPCCKPDAPAGREISGSVDGYSDCAGLVPQPLYASQPVQQPLVPGRVAGC